MFYPYFFACALTCLLPLYVSNAQVSAATPVCLQSRTSTDPVAAALQSSVDSDKSIQKACDPSTQQIRVTPWTHTFYALDDYLFFNSSLQDLPSIGTPASTPTSYPGNQECAYNFNAIVSLCLIQEKFWGGWIESKGLNYSINYVLPATGSTSAGSMSPSVRMSSNHPHGSAIDSTRKGTPTGLGTPFRTSDSSSLRSTGATSVEGSETASALDASKTSTDKVSGLPEGSTIGSLQDGSPTTLGKHSGVSKSKSVGSTDSIAAQDTKSASAQIPPTKLVGSKLSLSPISTSGTGQKHGPATPGTRSGLTVADSIATPNSQSDSDLSSRPNSANFIITSGRQQIDSSSHTVLFSDSATGGSKVVDGTLTHLSNPKLAKPRSSHSAILVPVTTSAPKPTGADSQSALVTSLSGSDSKRTPSPSLRSDLITTTNTVPPSDASTEGTTNTAFSANFWLTTQIAGQTTVVPVIVGCPGCGGKGGGIILWNIPLIPGVSFQFPKFGLPPISFPCIPIPFIKSCSSPPTSDGSKDPNNPNKPSPSDPIPSETQAKETKSKTSAHSSTTPASTGSSMGTSSSLSSTTKASSSSACPLKAYRFSLPSGTDSTTLSSATGTDPVTGPLPPGKGFTTLSTASGPKVTTGISLGSVTTDTSSAIVIRTSTIASETKASLRPIAAGALAAVASAISKAAVSAESVATAFSPDKTTLSCGQKYSTDTGATYTSVPRAQTNDILRNAADFCTPGQHGAGPALVFQKGAPLFHSYRFNAPGLMLYQFNMVWDPRPECANVPAPVIRDAVPMGPDGWCAANFDALTNTCDPWDVQNRNGGTLYAGCVIWSWEAFDGCTGTGANPADC